MNVSEYIAERLSKEVKNVFSVVGGGSMYLNEAFRDMAVYLHHEQACAIAAEAYARLNGFGVAVVTTGPGGTNALTGVLCAYQDSIPMIVISGQVRTGMIAPRNMRQLGDQEADIISMVEPITKYAATVMNPYDIVDELDYAIRTAKEGRPGPVWLDIPLDVQKAQVVDVANVISLISTSSRPLLLVGSGIPRGSEELLERVGLPVVTAFNASDRLPYGHKSLVGTTSTIGQIRANTAMSEADLIISVGCRLNPRQIGYDWKLRTQKPRLGTLYVDGDPNGYERAIQHLVVVDIDPEELEKSTLPPHLSVCADATLFLRCLANQSYERAQMWVSGEIADSLEGIYKRFRDLPTNADDIIVLANATPSVVGIVSMPVLHGQVVITNSGPAPMGYALPAAIGIAHLHPEKRVICIEGDGSLMMNVQEMANVPHNMRLIVVENGGYSSIRQTQDKFGLHQVGNDPVIPSIRALAATFNLSYSFNDLSDLDSAQIFEMRVEPDQKFLPKWEFK
jgi:acetolactate synthase-1/2/3 large subunit